MGIKRIRPAAMCSRPDCEGGGYLLSHFRSTIGVAGFNFSVRNGKRWNPRAVTTLVFSFSCRRHLLGDRCGVGSGLPGS